MEREYLKLDKVNFENLKFSKNKNKQGQKFIFIYHQKKQVCLSLPKQIINNKPIINTNYNTSKVEIELKITDELLEEKFSQLDKLLPKFSIENGWFEDNVETKYIPTLKSGNFIKFKASYIDTVVFDKNNQEIPLEDNKQLANLLTKNSMIKVGLRSTGVFFFDNVYGVSWKADQIKIIERKEEEEEFVSTDEEDISDEECWL